MIMSGFAYSCILPEEYLTVPDLFIEISMFIE